MGDLADEVAAKLEATAATAPLGQIVFEKGGKLPPRNELLIEETLTTLLEFQRTLGEELVHVAYEIDKLRGT
jgi:hypothetical protein